MTSFLNIIRHDCGPRYDANETAAFSRELEYVHSEVIVAKYPEFKGRNMVPIKSGGIPLGATSHRWFELDSFGQAKYLDNLATDDFPTQELKGAELTGTIKSIGAKYATDIQELRASALMRVKPDLEKAKQARKSIEALIDKTIVGSATGLNGGFAGIAHNSSSTVYTPAATSGTYEGGTAGNWFAQINTAPQRIVHDVRGACEAAFLETKGLFAQFDMFLPPELGVLMARPMAVALPGAASTQVLSQTLGQYLLSSIPYLRSISTDNFRLSGVGTGGDHRVLLYPRDPEVLDFFIPLEVEQFAPQLSGMAFVTHLHSRVAGLRIKHPKAIRRIDIDVS